MIDTNKFIGVLNPNGVLLMRFITNPQIRTIFMRGGSSSGKTYSTAQVITLVSYLFGGKTMVFRKVGSSIENTVYADFKRVCEDLLGSGNYTAMQNRIVIPSTGAQIDFSGLDDPEKIKGIAGYQYIVLEEVTEMSEEDYKQVRKRLRGMKNQKIIATFNPISSEHWLKTKVYDNEEWHDIPMNKAFSVNFASEGKKMVLDFDYPDYMTKVAGLKCNSAKMTYNPVTRKMEEHKPDTIDIQSTYLNNYWVAGCPVEGQEWGYYDQQTCADFMKDKENDAAYYQVYALGEWGSIKTGSEYLSSFKVGKHTGEIPYDAKLPIHASVDNNVLPYITCTLWQIHYDENINLCQFDELLARPPQNTVKKAARLLVDYLHSLKYEQPLMLHADYSTKASTTFDEDKRSWLDLYEDTLKENGIEVQNCVSRFNPRVIMRGEFLNAILDEMVEGARMLIGNNCSVSINDYTSVQKDSNGGVHKKRVKDKQTGQTYEVGGHALDTLTYFVCDILSDEFTDFSNARKRNMFGEKESFKFYNPHLKYDYDARVIYCNPNVRGFVIMFVAERNRGTQIWHILHAVYTQIDSVEELKNRIYELKYEHEERDEDFIVMECGKAYYNMVSEMREDDLDVRVKSTPKNSEQITAALSDYVKNQFLFDSERKTEGEYGDFLIEVMDYNKDTSYQCNCVSCLSSFAHLVIKTMQD